MSAPAFRGRRPWGRRERVNTENDRQGRGEQQAPQPTRRHVLLRPLRSVSGQVFVLQVLIVILLVLAAGAELILQAQRDSQREASNRSVAVAQTFAHSPGIIPALQSPNPTAVLQPLTETARVTAGVDFIVVMNTKGIRYTHPIPNRIGKKFVGTIGPALAGQTVTETIKGTIGPLEQAVVPVTDHSGKVVGLVSAGITISKVSRAVNRQLPILFGAAAVALVLAMGGTAAVSRRLRRQTHGLEPAEMTRMYEHHDAVLHAVREGVLIVDGDGRLLLANDEAARLLELPPNAEGRHVGELGIAPHMAELLASGRVATDEMLQSGDRLLAVNNRPTDRNGGPPGSVATLRDSTELRLLSGRAEAARKRLKLLYDAGVGIGTTLDIQRTAQELAQVAVPRFADFVSVDLAEPVLRGEEPPIEESTQMVRVALGGVRKNHPFYSVGKTIEFVRSTPQARGFGRGSSVIEPDLRLASGWKTQDPLRAKRVLDYGIHSLITVPLNARGVVLGVASFWRSRDPNPFDEDDVSLAEELVIRAAVSIDNARRYTREHKMAVTLQHSLLPRGVPEQSAVDVAYRYLPAQEGVGGDWFDVIPLPGSRVALVVGDVVGHGLHASATMGRLRTAVHNFTTLDLPPDELLGHLDELVTRIDREETSRGGEGAITGATCLYAIYDPVSGYCTMSRAGHVLPALVGPDGTVRFPDLPAGPPLGLGGLPFQNAQLRLEPGSQLVMYTDGLVDERDRDIDVGLDMLTNALSHVDRPAEETCDAVLNALLPVRQSDDIVLLVARPQFLRADQIAEWDVPFDPAAVAGVRAQVTEQLNDWGLVEAVFTTELVLSELITNAIRYATSPIRVRLIRDRTLICEVSDASSTSPHLRYAATTDEGGRGLFLVAQLADRWGTRYTSEGKVIWAELPLA